MDTVTFGGAPPKPDMLGDAFRLQREFMDILCDNDVLPEFPVDLRTKFGQRLIREFIWNTTEELAEASFTLKNKMHKLSDDREVDLDHYREELGDAFAFFLEICILSGIDAEQLYEQYKNKSAIVRQRVQEGY